jgi:hypothetical protein
VRKCGCVRALESPLARRSELILLLSSCCSFIPSCCDITITGSDSTLGGRKTVSGKSEDGYDATGQDARIRSSARTVSPTPTLSFLIRFCFSAYRY